MQLAKTFATIDDNGKENDGLTIRSSTFVGTIGNNPLISVSALEILSSKMGIQFSGVEIKMVDEDGLESNSCLISNKESLSVFDSIDSVCNFKFRSDRYQSTQARSSVCGIDFIAFNDDDGNLRSAIQIDNDICFLQSQHDLLDLRRLIEITIDHIQSLPS